MGVVIVPQQKAYVVERLGKFHAVLDSGFHLLIPFIDKVAYAHSLKEEAITIPNQTAITKDNVVLQIDGVLYLRVVDPKQASYGISDAIYALTQLAQTTMRSELGKITLDETMRERESLNHHIVASINDAAKSWGTEVLRYEIKDITPPTAVKAAMEMQAEAERRKRAEILESEGHREAAINNAEGKRQSSILAARGEAEAIRARAEAAANAIELLANSLNKAGGREAVTVRLAEQYLAAFGRIAKAGNTILLPANASDPSSMVAQAMAVWNNVQSRSSLGVSPEGLPLPMSSLPVSAPVTQAADALDDASVTANSTATEPAEPGHHQAADASSAGSALGFDAVDHAAAVAARGGAAGDVFTPSPISHGGASGHSEAPFTPGGGAAGGFTPKPF